MKIIQYTLDKVWWFRKLNVDFLQITKLYISYIVQILEMVEYYLKMENNFYGIPIFSKKTAYVKGKMVVMCSLAIYSITFDFPKKERICQNAGCCSPGSY